MNTSTPVTKTPVTKNPTKRALSSPFDDNDLKKTRAEDSPASLSSSATMSDMEDMNVSGLGSGSGSGARPSLSQVDIDRISKALENTFESKLSTIVKSVVSQVLGDLRVECDKLKAENDALKSRVLELENKADSAEQYSRRNCLRVTGIAEQLGESTDDIVLKMAKALDASVSQSDIDRSHRVGKPLPASSRSKGRSIIVKFATYRARQSFFKARKRAKDCGYEGSYINEDLTRFRSNLLFQARNLVKCKKIQGAWSSDGTILVKDTLGVVQRVSSPADLSRFETT